VVRYKVWRSRKDSSLSARLGAVRVVPAAEDELRPHLDSGEKLLWAGRPAQGIVLTRLDGYLIAFFAVWLYAGHSLPPHLLFTAIGFVICFLSGLQFACVWYRSRLIYGVTDRRAIILSGMPSFLTWTKTPTGCVRYRSVQSIYFSSLITLKLEERRDRSGTIYFGEDFDSRYHNPEFNPRDGGTQFFRIADAKRVFTILQEAIQRQRRQRSRSFDAPIRR
jgi:hypothetical protein